MVTLDDVNKVFGKEDSALSNAKSMMKRVQNPASYCRICGKKMGVCKHSR